MTQTNAATTLAAKLAAGKEDNTDPKDLVVAEKFQEFKASRSSVRLITHNGIRITFTNFKLLTQNPDVIEYLSEEIKRGLPGITKGALLTLDDVNPMATMRREVEAQVRAELAEEAQKAALGITKDMGGTEHKAQIAPASTNSVAS